MLEHSVLIIRDNVLFDVPALEFRFNALLRRREEEICREVGGASWSEKLDYWRQKFLPFMRYVYEGELFNPSERGMPKEYFFMLHVYAQAETWGTITYEDLRNELLSLPCEDAPYHESIAWNGLGNEILKIPSSEVIDFLNRYADYSANYHYSRFDGDEKYLIVLTTGDFWPTSFILNEIECNGATFLVTSVLAPNIAPDTPPLQLINHVRHFCGNDHDTILPRNAVLVTRNSPDPEWSRAGIRQIVFQPDKPVEGMVGASSRDRGRAFAASTYAELGNWVTDNMLPKANVPMPPKRNGLPELNS